MGLSVGHQQDLGLSGLSLAASRHLAGMQPLQYPAQAKSGKAGRGFQQGRVCVLLMLFLLAVRLVA